MTKERRGQLDKIDILLSQLEQKATAQNDKNLYPLISCACGARRALESISEDFWDGLQFDYTENMISEMVKGHMSEEWIAGFNLNDANVRTDALRDRLYYYLDEKYRNDKIDSKPAEYLTENSEVSNVYNDVRSFKHYEYVQPVNKTKRPPKNPASQRQSAPHNTAVALEKLLKKMIACNIKNAP